MKSASVTFGYGGGGSYSQSKTNSHYNSVNEVSGIAAGDGGFDLAVGGGTHLIGGVLASTADPAKNSLDTGSLTWESIHNEASYSASSFGVGAGTGGLSPSLAIPQHKSSISETESSIAAGTITVRDGNADLTGLKRDGTLDDQALKAIFDEKKVREQQALGIVAGQVGMTAVGDVSAYMYSHATTPEEQAKWADGGQNKVLLHGLVGAASAALGGGNAASGAIGSGASEAASQAMAQYLVDHNIDPNLPEGRALMALASTAIGGAAGGGSGAAEALNGAKYNRELHVDEQAAIANLAATSKKKYTEEEVQAVACAMVKCVSGRGLTEPQSLADGLISGSPTFTPAGQALVNQYNSILAGMSEEKKLEIKAQLTATGLFGYGYGDAFSDAWADAHGTTRIEGLEKASQGFINAYTSATVCKFAPSACGPATFSVAKEADTFGAGVSQYWTGGAAPSLEEWGYQTAGLSQQNAAAAKQLTDVIAQAVTLRVGMGPGTTSTGPSETPIGTSVDDEVDALGRIGRNPNGPDLSGRPPNTVANQQAVSDLAAGKLPGNPINGIGTPREMPGTLNPNATAEDFATRVLGRQPTVEEIARGSKIKVNGQTCSGCWIASPDGGNTYITYRPAGVASDTLPTTSTVEVNYKAAANAANAGEVLKLKFPLVNH